MNVTTTGRTTRVPASVIGLLTIAAALILPYVHIWLQGADKLVALHVARRRAQGLIPDKFLYVSQQVAENRIQAQGIIDAITVGVTLIIFTLVVWLLSRWRTVRVPFASAVRVSSAAIWAEMAFYALLYVVVWVVLGGDAMRISWTGLVPTDAGRLVTSGSLLWALLRSLSIGAAIRFVTLSFVLRREEPALSARDAWIVAGGASFAVVIAGLFLQQL